MTDSEQLAQLKIKAEEMRETVEKLRSDFTTKRDEWLDLLVNIKELERKLDPANHKYFDFINKRS